MRTVFSWRAISTRIGRMSRLPTEKQLLDSYMLYLLKHNNGNRSEVARIMGVTYRTIFNRLKEIEEDDGE